MKNMSVQNHKECEGCEWCSKEYHTIYGGAVWKSAATEHGEQHTTYKANYCPNCGRKIGE